MSADSNRCTAYGVAQIQQIRLLPPEADDPVPCIFKIESTGRSERGLERRVLGYATFNPMMALRIPAALISFETVVANGTSMVHWGEVWAKSNIKMQAKAHYNYLSSDPNAKWRTEGLIDQWGGGWKTSGNNPDVLLTQDDMGVAADYVGRFFQNQDTDSFPSDWPEFDYQTFKELALAHGRYYSTDAAGNIYRDGIEDAAHKVNFGAEFSVADRETAPYDLIFIDTIDGNEPAADGSNLATIKQSGSTIGLKGIVYIGAHFDTSGQGNPDSLEVEDPYGNSKTLPAVFHDGVLYSAGFFETSGNPVVYGSIVAQRGFRGSGTPDIYYNQSLANGMQLGNGNAGAVFNIVLQTNY